MVLQNQRSQFHCHFSSLCPFYLGIAGLAVTYGLNFDMIQTSFIWILCNLENEIISVERILQYSSIPSEPPLIVEDNRPDHSWPSKGEIDIVSIQVLFSEHILITDKV